MFYISYILRPFIDIRLYRSIRNILTILRTALYQECITSICLVIIFIVVYLSIKIIRFVDIKLHMTIRRKAVKTTNFSSCYIRINYNSVLNNCLAKINTDSNMVIQATISLKVLLLNSADPHTLRMKLLIRAPYRC